MSNNNTSNNTRDPFQIYLASCARVNLERLINYVDGFHPALKTKMGNYRNLHVSRSWLFRYRSIVMCSPLPFLISLPTNTVIFCFPPPTLTTPSNPSLTPNFCAFPPLVWWQRFWDQTFGTEFLERSYPTHLLDSAIEKAFSISVRVLWSHLWPKFLMIKFLSFWHFIPLTTKLRTSSAIFTDNPLISFRRNRNIGDNLVRRSLRQVL